MNLHNEHSRQSLQYARTLRAAGYRVTPQRIALFEALRASHDHPPAEVLYQRVRRTHPTMSRASVYKSLQLLASLGLAVQLEGTDGAVRFDGDLSPHVNMVCVRCGRIEDLAGIDVGPLLREVARASGFAVGHHLALRGMCPRCQRESQQQQQRKVVRHGTAGTGSGRGRRR